MNILVSVFCELIKKSHSRKSRRRDTRVFSLLLWFVSETCSTVSWVWAFNLQPVALFWVVVKTAGSVVLQEEVDNWTGDHLRALTCPQFLFSLSLFQDPQRCMCACAICSCCPNHRPWCPSWHHVLYALKSWFQISSFFLKLFLFDLIISLLF